MKKKLSLKIKRETLRQLDKDQSKFVVGGITNPESGCICYKTTQTSLAC